MPNELEMMISDALAATEEQALEKMDRVYAALLSSQLYVLTGEGGQEEDEIAIVQFSSQDGPVVPVFTSLDMVQAVKDNTYAHTSMLGWHLFENLKGVNLAINPETPYSFGIHGDHIADMLDHYSIAEQPFEDDAEITLSPPAQDISQLKDSLSHVLSQSGQVRVAYIAHAVNAKNNEKSMLVGILFSGDVDQSLINLASTTAGRFVPADHFLDFVVLREGENEGIIGGIFKTGEKFYAAAS